MIFVDIGHGEDLLTSVFFYGTANFLITYSWAVLFPVRCAFSRLWISFLLGLVQLIES